MSRFLVFPKSDIGIYLFGKSRNLVKKDSFLSHKHPYFVKNQIMQSFFM